MKSDLSRRRFIVGTGASIGAVVAGKAAAVASERAGEAGVPFTYCLNTSTIRGQKLSLDKEIEIAAAAGYTGIEPWVRKISDYAGNGGNLRDLR